MSDYDLKPGSDEAVEAGCTCAVLDNAHGRGYMGRKGMYVISCDCPLHAPQPSIPHHGPINEPRHSDS